MNGVDATTWGDYVSYKQSGAMYPGYCPAGEEFVQDSLTSVNTNLLSGLAGERHRAAEHAGRVGR